MVRCGSCRTQFDAPGPGRYSCPSCGSVNVVRDPGAAQPPPAEAPGGYPTAPGAGMPPPPPPDRPTPPRIDCPKCGFSFHVGEVAKVVCPNCNSEVVTGLVELEDEPEVADADSEE